MLKELEKVFTLILRKILLCDYIYYFLFLFSLIYILFFLNNKYEYLDCSNIKTYTGIITDIFINNDKMEIIIEDDLKIKVNYYYEEYINLNLGDKIIVYGELLIPSNNTNPNLFSYRSFLKSKDIFYIFNADNIKKISNNNNIFYSIKNLFREKISKNKVSNYLYTFILGDNRYLDSDVKSSYQELGISHLFSVSGMHISIFTNIILFIFKKNSENKRLFFCSIFILFYMFLVNYCPSVLRSGLFFILNSLNIIFYLNIKPINILLIVVSLIILDNPFIVYNTGFLYSCVITGSLILSSSIINKYDNYFIKLFLTSFIAFLFSFPISIYSYYQINIFTIFYNLFFVPLISIVIFPLSLFCFLFPFFSNLLEMFIYLLENISLFLSKFNTNIIFIKPSIFLCVIYYLLLILLFKFKKKFLFVILLIIIVIHYNYNIVFPSTYILMIDVGQGDSILLHSSKYNILVDTGGNSYRNYSLSNNTLIPLFRSLGIRKIDYLFLSHGDYDHVGEAINLVNNFKVNHVYFNEGEFVGNEIKIIDLLEKKNIDYSVSYEGKYYKIGDFSFYSLGTKSSDENASSMILYGFINDHSFLFTGDASYESERRLLSKYNISNIDILKVGHHGSNTSSSKEFVEKINPKYAFISVGENNKFKHPSEEVLNNLNDSIIYRTDLDGGVLIQLKNNKLDIKTYKP